MRRRPHHTPRTTLGLGLWVFGLYAALFAAAPGAITPQQEAAYEQHMRVVRAGSGHERCVSASGCVAAAGLTRCSAAAGQAESFLPARTEAAVALAIADARVDAAKTWFWRLKAEDKARVRSLQAERAAAAAAAGRADADWARHVRSARAQLGVWSDAGVREARKQFWCVRAS
jgi:hypothetical protein